MLHVFEVLENEMTSIRLLDQHLSNKDSVAESSSSSDSSDTESESEETINTAEAKSANAIAPNVPMNMTITEHTGVTSHRLSSFLSGTVKDSLRQE